MNGRVGRENLAVRWSLVTMIFFIGGKHGHLAIHS